MIDYAQFNEYVLHPTLQYLGCDSQNAGAVMMMTGLIESQMGTYLHQLGKGPACGMFEMEPATHDDLWKNFLAYRPHLAERIRYFELEGAFDDDNAYEMCGNLYYATAMARMQYWRHSEPLPDHRDIEGMARYYKKYFNSAGGASTVDRTVRLYKQYVKANSGE